METLSKHWLSISMLAIVATLAGLLTAQNAKQAASRAAAHPTTQPVAKAKPLIRVIPKPNNKLDDLLKQKVKFNMRDMHFEDVISEYFHVAYKLNIVVNWKALEMMRSDIKEVPINANLKDISLRKALDTVLALAGGSEAELGYFEKDGVIHINTVENINMRMTTRIYDCTNLLFNAEEAANRTSLNLVTEIANTPPETTGYIPYSKSSSSDSLSLFDDPPRNKEKKRYDDLLTQKEKIQNLIFSICGNVDKDSWDRNGGTAQIHTLGTSLIINQTRTNHRRILALLENLRKMQKLKQERQPLVIRAWWVSGSNKEWGDLQSKLKKDSSLKLTAEVLNAAAPNTLAVGRGFNRQPILLTNGNGQLLITGVEPVVSDNTAISAPVTQNIFFGKMLRITATLRNENEQAMVDIDSLASSLRQVAQKPYKDSNGNFAIDNPIYSAGELKTQTVIPVGKPMLIGGFTGKSAENKKAKTPAEPLLLFVQIDVPKPLDK